MTDQTARAEDEAAQQAQETAAAAPQPTPSTALEREHAEMKDRLLRTLAEMENLRKRTEREVADARLYGASSFARDVIAVEGVELTERELLKALEKNGVRQFTPQGEKFDPNVHQAMFEVPDASVPAGSIVQVVQPGYMIGERMLRPALVGVSKGGVKVAPNSASGNDNKASA
jgi:molecular chaperone GrpE